LQLTKEAERMKREKQKSDFLRRIVIVHEKLSIFIDFSHTFSILLLRCCLFGSVGLLLLLLLLLFCFFLLDYQMIVCGKQNRTRFPRQLADQRNFSLCADSCVFGGVWEKNLFSLC
jgi:hypothetical protein